MQPELVKEFAAELVRVEHQIRAVIEAIKEGMRTPGIKDELLALEARKSALAAEVQQAPAPAPRLHPRLANIYRDKVERLQESLNVEASRAEATEALRGLVEEIRLVPENGQLAIELAGDLAGILTLTSGNKKPVSSGDGPLQVTLVAGERNHRQLTLPSVLIRGSNGGLATNYVEHQFGMNERGGSNRKSATSVVSAYP